MRKKLCSAAQALSVHRKVTDVCAQTLRSALENAALKYTYIYIYTHRKLCPAAQTLRSVHRKLCSGTFSCAQKVMFCCTEAVLSDAAFCAHKACSSLLLHYTTDQRSVQRGSSKKLCSVAGTLDRLALIHFAPCMDMHGFTLVYIYIYIYIYTYVSKYE